MLPFNPCNHNLFYFANCCSWVLLFKVCALISWICVCNFHMNALFCQLVTIFCWPFSTSDHRSSRGLFSFPSWHWMTISPIGLLLPLLSKGIPLMSESLQLAMVVLHHPKPMYKPTEDVPGPSLRLWNFGATNALLYTRFKIWGGGSPS